MNEWKMVNMLINFLWFANRNSIWFFFSLKITQVKRYLCDDCNCWLEIYKYLCKEMIGSFKYVRREKRMNMKYYTLAFGVIIEILTNDLLQ